jgi:antitoxin component YwqK of YwqJK toxin-antitoxin module
LNHLNLFNLFNPRQRTTNLLICYFRSINTICMNRIITSITFFLCCFSAFAQVEKYTWNGKEYYVYPHQDESMAEGTKLISVFANQREVLHRDDKNRKVLSVTIEPIEPDPQYKFLEKDKEFKKIMPVLKEGLAEDPYFFLPQQVSLAQEVTPATEPLPDGEYVQFYRDVPYLDGKTLRFRNDVVASVFGMEDGLIDGSIEWFTVTGRSSIKGFYTKGERTGNWSATSYIPHYPEGFRFDDVRSYRQAKEQLSYWTSVETQEYAMSLRNGLNMVIFEENDTLKVGHYKDDKPVGEWIEWTFLETADDEPFENRTRILRERYTIAEDPKIGRSLILREDFVPPGVLEQYVMNFDNPDAEQDTSFVLPDTWVDFPSFSDFYDIAYPDPEEEDLDLPEENSYSYEGMEEPEYEWESEGDYYEPARQQLIDSLGYRFKYTGIYERYHTNGQLAFRFEIRDGVLVEEDTVYWDNGLPASVVVFVPDSNRYEVRYYDYHGKPGPVELFDAKGESLEEPETYDWSVYDLEATIGGRDFVYADGNDVFIYENPDGLKGEITEKRILEQKLWKRDSSTCLLKTYDPETRTLETTITAISKKPAFHETVAFADDFQSLSLRRDHYVGDIRYSCIGSGSFGDFSYYIGKREDSLTNEEKYVAYWDYSYSVDLDGQLFLKDKPFTGDVKIERGKRKYSLRTSDSKIAFTLPKRDFKQVWGSRYKYWKRGKLLPILDVVQPKVTNRFTEPAVLDVLPELRDYLTEYYEDYDYELEAYMADDELSREEKKELAQYVKQREASPRAMVAAGSYRDGRAAGRFSAKDQHGRVMVADLYENGDLNGIHEVYRTEMPRAGFPADLADQFPDRTTRYLAMSQEFRNGYLNGPSLTFGWKGDTTSFYNFVNSSREGFGYERNALVYSYGTYEYDSPDGISRTYLTLPGRDSILLFDLNFQNGALQGESKAYHPNGRLAKRGFFLTGQPIDDYEAYDTLGNIYQYVKFQYDQPVEEKIWEENQLSVRYQFDWRDSIDFYVGEIAEVPSVDRLLTSLGYADGDHNAYYGRPSVVDKSGIDYYMTKYYPNDTVAREGGISSGKKVGCWSFYSYEGDKLCEIEYFDTIMKLNDSISFRSKGVLSYLDPKGEATSHSYIIEKFEKYDCSHTDHYEERMLWTFWERDTSYRRLNGYVKNYYDNGALMNEGSVMNGLPTGVWKLYDNAGNLSHVGEYVNGKRQGRWMSGDLGNVKFLGDICLNPNLPNLEEIMSYQEKLLDITVTYYRLGEVLKKEYYGINMNSGDAPEGYYGEEMYGDY